MFSFVSYLNNCIFSITKKFINILDEYLFNTFDHVPDKHGLFKNNVTFNFDTLQYKQTTDVELTFNKKLSVNFKFNHDYNIDSETQIYINLLESLFLSVNDIYLNSTIDSYNIITQNLKLLINNHYLYDTLYPLCVYNMEIDIYKNRKISTSNEYLNKGYHEIKINNNNFRLLSINELEIIFSVFITHLLVKRASDIYILCTNVR